MVPIGYMKVSLRMMFDLNLKFLRKARLVTGGHMTNTPTDFTSMAVVSSGVIHTCLIIAFIMTDL